MHTCEWCARVVLPSASVGLPLSFLIFTVGISVLCSRDAGMCSAVLLSFLSGWGLWPAEGRPSRMPVWLCLRHRGVLASSVAPELLSQALRSACQQHSWPRSEMLHSVLNCSNGGTEQNEVLPFSRVTFCANYTRMPFP